MGLVSLPRKESCSMCQTAIRFHQNSARAHRPLVRCPMCLSLILQPSEEVQSNEQLSSKTLEMLADAWGSS
ncbi:hypothetical protein CRG98_049691, partial [Punica granatum]